MSKSNFELQKKDLLVCKSFPASESRTFFDYESCK